MSIKICLYCKLEKPINEFSQEHILPSSVVGRLINNLFTTNDVCERCNSLCGIFVDGPFKKSWPISNYKAAAFLKGVDLSKTPILPLNYFGEIEDLQYGTKICDVWSGPIGDMIYHFHDSYPEELDTPPMIGVPSTAFKKKVDAGFAFIFVKANNPVWHPTILHSFLNQFKKSDLYLGNGPTPAGGAFKDIPHELMNLHDTLKTIQGKEHQVTVKMGINYAYRFQCKIALGFGHLLLHPSFLKSESADLLRKGLWSKSEEAKKDAGIHGSGSWGKNLDGVKAILKWPGGIVIALMIVANKLMLYANFYEENSFVVEISNEPELWKGKINEGLVYVVSPQLNKAIGPIALPTFLVHKVSPPIPVPELISLEDELNSFGELPPYVILI